MTGLLVIAGLSSIATGLAPLDRGPAEHAIAAAPLFVAQPIALALLGVRVRARQPRLGIALVVVAVVTGAAALSFVLAGDGPVTGVLERLALWPVLVALAVFGWTQLRARRPQSG